MPRRYFTPEEASELLPQVRVAAETLVEHRRALVEATTRRAELATRIAGNGGDFDPQEPRELEEELEREAEAVARAVSSLEELGVQVKDLDHGLVDFPALRANGEEVLLCWRVGESAVEFWHTLEDGYAGRRRIDW